MCSSPLHIKAVLYQDMALLPRCCCHVVQIAEQASTVDLCCLLFQHGNSSAYGQAGVHDGAAFGGSMSPSR